MIRRPPRSTRTDTLFPTRRSSDLCADLQVTENAEIFNERFFAQPPSRGKGGEESPPVLFGKTGRSVCPEICLKQVFPGEIVVKTPETGKKSPFVSAEVALHVFRFAQVQGGKLVAENIKPGNVGILIEVLLNSAQIGRAHV